MHCSWRINDTVTLKKSIVTRTVTVLQEYYVFLNSSATVPTAIHPHPFRYNLGVGSIIYMY